MLNLLKADLVRIFKDKLFLVVCIIGGALAIFSPILYEIIFLSLDAMDFADMLIDSKSLFFSAFSPSNNFGLIVPVLMAIILCKDFSYGTVRNKIICGKSRFSIFMSMFISGTVVTCAVMLAHALLTLLVSMLFFDYQQEAITGADIGYLFLSILFELLVYVLISALISYLCASRKNVGVVIVLYIVINFVFSIIGTIVQFALMATDPAKEGLVKLWEFLDNANIFTSTIIGYGTKYEPLELLAILLPTIIGGALLVLLGIFSFKKKDLK